MRPPILPILAALAVAPTLAMAAPSPDDGPLQPPDVAGQRSAGIAAAAPMHDMNLMSQKIPPVLMAVMADPYARPASLDCAALDADVQALNAALGDDFDAVVIEDNSPQARHARTEREGLHAGSEALLPFSGFVRTLSGAAQRDKLVMDAIMSGDTRRAYLRGIAETRGCQGPVSPVHMTHSFGEPTDYDRSASR